MELLAENFDDVLVIRADQDRIDAACAIRFKDLMRDLTQTSAARIILDMSKVTFIDSSGLGAIVAAMKAVGPDRQLELAGLTDTVQKVFRLTRMDTIFKIHDSLAFGMAKAS